jgi:hypothetical protein
LRGATSAEWAFTAEKCEANRTKALVYAVIAARLPAGLEPNMRLYSRLNWKRLE